MPVFRHLFAAKTELAAKETPVNLDFLVREVDDLFKEEAQILEDQKEILKTIQNLKIWANKK